MTDIEKTIKAAIFTPGTKGWGLPLLFMGLSGIGKSDIIEEIGDRWKMPVVVLSPGELGEGAFGVTPVPDNRAGGMRITYPAPDWIDSFEDFGNRGIVFIDEMTLAPPLLQGPLLGVIHAKRIGSHRLPPGVRTLGAANPPEYAAGGWHLTAPLSNRVGHVQWVLPTAEEWADYTVSHNGLSKPQMDHGDAAKEEERVAKLWPTAYAKASGLFVAFHNRTSGTKLHAQPKAKDPTAGKAWPSHRSNSNAIRAWASGDVHGLDFDETIAMVKGFIGEGLTKELIAFKVANDLPSPADVLDGVVKFEHDADRVDRTMAVFSACSALIVGEDKKRDKRIGTYAKMLDATFEDAADLVVQALRPLSRANLSIHESLIGLLAKSREVVAAVNAA